MKFIQKPVTAVITSAGRQIENRRFTRPPIYIGGCGRSGTTLLLSILSSHKEIFACPNELNLFYDFRMEADHIYLPKFYRLYRTFILHKIKKSANRYCEKSPANIQRFEVINQYHKGNFKLIHIIRDGRDVTLSKHPKKRDQYWVEPERWLRDVSMGLQYLDHPNVYTVRYEELVNDFINSITKICKFLEIEVSADILNWHKHTTVRRNRALETPIKEISNQSIGKFKKPVNEQRLNEFMKNDDAVSLLKSLGYI